MAYIQYNSDSSLRKSSNRLDQQCESSDRKAPCDDWKINDLCRRFDILYPGDTFGENSLNRVYALVIAISTRSHVALDANNVYVDNIYRYVRFMPLSRLQYTFR